MRKIRIEEEGKVQPSPPKPKTQVRELVVKLQEQGTGEMLEQCTDQEVSDLIDYAFETQSYAKEAVETAEKVVPHVKQFLLELAKKRDVKFIKSNRAKAVVSPSSSTKLIGSIKDFMAMLKKEGKLHLLDTCLSVRVTDSKKYLGEDLLKSVMEVKSEEFGSVSIKRL